MAHDAQSPRDWAANVCVKNPIGATCRSDKNAVALGISVKVPPPGIEVSRAKGLDSQPPGSAGKPSRPAMVKLL